MLTRDQERKLRKAIKSARGHGACQYVKSSKPYCVMGQLAHLEGVPLKVLRRWDTEATFSEGAPDVASNSIMGVHQDGNLPARLKLYPMRLLNSLQRCFDHSVPDWTAERVRTDMLRILDRHVTRSKAAKTSKAL